MSAPMVKMWRLGQHITQVLETKFSCLRCMQDVHIESVSFRSSHTGTSSETFLSTATAVELEAKLTRTLISRRNFTNKLSGLSSVRMYSSERFCWKCGRGTLPWEYFFCDCGMVQAPASTINYFSLFGMKMNFDVDTHELSKLYKDLQQKLHPDKYSQNSEEEKYYAGEQSSLVNKAYFTLLKPLSRGLYMLELHGCPIEEASGEVDAGFLMEVLELNERLDGAKSNEEVTDIEAEIWQLIGESIEDISNAFRIKDFEEAKRLLVRYKYFGNIDDKIRERHRRAM